MSFSPSAVRSNPLLHQPDTEDDSDDASSDLQERPLPVSADRFPWAAGRPPTSSSSFFSSSGRPDATGSGTHPGPARGDAGASPLRLPLERDTVLTPAIMDRVLAQVFGDRRPTGNTKSICAVLARQIGYKPDEHYVLGCLHVHYGPDSTQTYRISDAMLQLLDLARQLLTQVPRRPLHLNAFRDQLALMRGAPVDSNTLNNLVKALNERDLIEEGTEDGATTIRLSASASEERFGALHKGLPPLCQCIDILRRHALSPGQTRPDEKELARQYPNIARPTTWRIAIRVLYGCTRVQRERVVSKQVRPPRDRTAETAQERQVVALVEQCWGYSASRLWDEVKRRKLGLTRAQLLQSLDRLREIAVYRSAYYRAGTKVPPSATARTSSQREAVFSRATACAMHVPGARLPIISGCMVPAELLKIWQDMRWERSHQFTEIHRDDPVLQGLLMSTDFKSAHGTPPPKTKFYFFDAYAAPSDISAEQLQEQVTRYMADAGRVVRNSELKERWRSEHHDLVMRRLCEQKVIEGVPGGFRHRGPPPSGDAQDGGAGGEPDGSASVGASSQADSESATDDEFDAPAPQQRQKTAAADLRLAMQRAPQRHSAPGPAHHPAVPPPRMVALQCLCNAMRASDGRAPITHRVLQEFMDAHGFTAAHLADPSLVANVLHAMNPQRLWQTSEILLKDPLWGVLPGPISTARARTHLRVERPEKKLLDTLDLLPQDRAVLCLSTRPYLIPIVRNEENRIWYCLYGVWGTPSQPMRTVRQVMNDYLNRCIVENAQLSVPARLRPEAIRERQLVHLLASSP